MEHAELIEAIRRRNELRAAVKGWMNDRAREMRLVTAGQAPMFRDYEAAEDEVSRLSALV